MSQSAHFSNFSKKLSMQAKRYKNVRQPRHLYAFPIISPPEERYLQISHRIDGTIRRSLSNRYGRHRSANQHSECRGNQIS